jgi:hypothetical protein
VGDWVLIGSASTMGGEIMNRREALLVLIATVMVNPGWAHHSFARFDKTKEITLKGTVEDFQWTNPHSWIYLLVLAPDGTTTKWSIEFGSPNALARQGWNKSAIKPGDKITAVINPVREGGPEGNLVSVTTADGVTFPQSGPANK